MAFARICTVAVDCPDPAALAEFYAGMLGGRIENFQGRGDWYDLYTPGGRMSFQRVPDHKPPQWPAADHDSQQLHLDLDVDDMETAEKQVLALGARPLDLDDEGGARDFRVYADPAGHPFCLIRPNA
ncbi:VOC family protein [Streptomyces sp. NPDC052225]|uniref:VOC family protein n=1 Tax=Streptomyces sp. NPDC052225 TaxID=3154949 RepID=UPI00342FF521